MPILEPLTTNKYTVIDSFNFPAEIVDQDSSNFMGSLDNDSLFVTFLIEEMIEISTYKLFKNNDIVPGLNKNKFRYLLSLAQQGRMKCCTF